MVGADRSSIPSCPIKLGYRRSAEIMFTLFAALHNDANVSGRISGVEKNLKVCNHASRQSNFLEDS